MTLVELLTQIADSIRAKKGTLDLINATDFPTEIESIETSSGGPTAKHFSTIEEMNASTDNKLGDLAVVYGFQNYGSLTETSEVYSISFPEKVTLSTAMTSSTAVQGYLMDESNSYSSIYSLLLSKTVFMVRDPNYNTVVRYTSTDNLNYTLDEGYEKSFNFGKKMHFSGTWNEVFGQFIQLSGFELNGLYQYEPAVTPYKTNGLKFMDITYDTTNYTYNLPEPRVFELNVMRAFEVAKKYILDNYEYDNADSLGAFTLDGSTISIIYGVMRYNTNPVTTKRGLPCANAYDNNTIIGVAADTNKISSDKNVYEIVIDASTYEVIATNTATKDFDYDSVIVNDFNDYYYLASITSTGLTSNLYISNHGQGGNTAEYTSSVYEDMYVLAPTQFTATPENVSEGCKFYGLNGIESGTYTEVTEETTE